MNKTKDTFQINELEILTGIKAHTIRIWEKRYQLLSPTRLNRNIRKYSLIDLQKLLSVSVLNKNGYKISKLSELSDKDLFEEARKVGLASIQPDFYVNELILSMYDFDASQFDQVYNNLCKVMSFEAIFKNVFISLLEYIGLLWQTDAIEPAHEHFISNLIQQKIVLQSASIEFIKQKSEPVYILFLPSDEMHVLGLLFLNYMLKLQGKTTIYLGGPVPFKNLTLLNDKFSNIHWICSFVVDRTEEEKENFISDFTKLIASTSNVISVVGKLWEHTPKNNKSLHFYTSIGDLITVS